MIPRHSALITTAVVAGVIGLAACTPVPTPEPTPTPLFASEAEAFKAAEQVYRDYVVAENAAQNGDQTVDPQTFLIGIALEEDLKSKRASNGKDVLATGEVIVIRFTATSYDPKSDGVGAAVCLDISGTRFHDQAGRDVTPAGRKPIVSLDVELTPDRKSLKITKMSASARPCS